MANALYTGTALTRDLKVDDSGQRALLDIAKSGAAQRLKDKAAKDKQIGDLSKEVSKNVMWNSSTVQPRNQASEKKIVEDSMATIVQGISTGELTSSEAYASMREAGVKLNSIRQMDAQQTAEFTKLIENSQKWGGLRPVTIKGVEYPNIAAAYNDSSLTPKEISEAVGTTEVSYAQNDILGEETAQFNFREREVLETAIDRVLGKDTTGYTTDTGKPDKFRLGDKHIQQNWLGLSPAAKEAAYNETLTDPVFDSISDELTKTNPELRNGSDEKFDKIQEVHKARFDAYIDSKKVKGNSFQYSPKAPKAPKATTFENYYELPNKPTQQVLTVVTQDANGVDINKDETFRRASLKMKKNPKYRSYTASEGGLTTQGLEGKIGSADRRTFEVASSGMASKGGESFVVFDIKGGGELFEPASANYPFQQWIDFSGINREDAFAVARMAHESSDLGIVSDHIMSMTEEGITPDKKGDPKDPAKTLSGTKAQLEAAAKSKGMTMAEYTADLESKGYTVTVK